MAERDVAFTGTRRGMTDAQAAMFEGLIERLRSFHHGSCEGSDVQAARIVRKVLGDTKIVAHPGPEGDLWREDSGVDDEVRPGKTHFARNRDIVNECDELIACPPTMEEQEFGGTWYTIRYARKKGKPVTIIWPDGSLG